MRDMFAQEKENRTATVCLLLLFSTVFMAVADHSHAAP